MISEKTQHVATIVAVIVGGLTLSLMLDSRIAVYVLVAVTSALALIFGILTSQKKLPKYPALHHAASSFFVWTSFAALFAGSTFQLVKLPVMLLLGAILAIVAAFLWPWPHDQDSKKMRIWLLALIAYEWFLMFLFAPANYMVLGALMSIAYTSTALLFEFHLANEHAEKNVARHLVVTAAIALIFILGFTWVL